MKHILRPVLAIKNFNQRDINIAFFENEHKYVISFEPDVKYTSVTTWIHEHFENFDSDKVIFKMMSGVKWKEGHKKSLAACHAPEAKAKSAAKHKKPVLQYDLQNNLIKEWPGIVDAQNNTGIGRHNIGMCLKTKTKSAGGFIWKYKNKQ